MTLIEVTVAGALLAVGAAAIIASWGSVMNVLEHERRFSEATNLSRMQLERLLVLPADSGPLGPGSYTVGTLDTFGAAAIGPSSYTVSYGVVSKPAPGFVEITVTTSWVETSGTMRSTSFNAFRER